MRLKDWLKTGAVHALAAIAASLGFSVMMYLLDMENLSFILEIATEYLVSFGAFMSLVLIMSVQRQTLPMALSFGSTRKEAFWGMQCYRALYLLLVMAAVMALFLLTGEGFTVVIRLIPLGLAVILTMGAVGSVCGIVGMQYGKGAAVAAGVVMGLLALGVGVGVGILIIKRPRIAVLSSWSLWLFAAIGLLLHIGSMAMEHRMIYKYNVKL